MVNDIIPSNADNISENSLFVHFKLGDKSYAIHSVHAIEILRLPKLEHPQKLPNFVIGLLNYNDVTINVIDLRAILDLEPKSFDVLNQLIILKTQESIMAIIVDKVVDVVSIPQEKMSSLPYFSQDNLIRTLYRNDDEMISIIDLFSVETILKDNQYSSRQIDYEKYLPVDEKSRQIFQERALKLIKNENKDFLPSVYSPDQFLIFGLEKNFYCINLKYVRELVELKNISITKLPFAPEYLEGVTNLRGDFHSIINLKLFLNNTNDENFESTAKKIIVLDSKEYKVAFLVDEIYNITSLNHDKYIHRSKNKFTSKYVLAEIVEDDSILNILNVEKFLNDEKLFINVE